MLEHLGLLVPRQRILQGSHSLIFAFTTRNQPTPIPQHPGLWHLKLELHINQLCVPLILDNLAVSYMLHAFSFLIHSDPYSMF